MRAKFAQNPKVQSILFSERLTSHLIPITIPAHVPESLAAKIAAFGLTSYSRVVYLGASLRSATPCHARPRSCHVCTSSHLPPHHLPSWSPRLIRRAVDPRPEEPRRTVRMRGLLHSA